MAMKSLRILTIAFACLLIISEIGRWWGQPRMMPLVFDELIVAGALLWSLALIPRHGMAPLAAAWGLYCGLMLALLVPTLDHLFFGPPKPSAGFYAGALGIALAAGVWALGRTLCLSRPKP